MNFDHFSFFQEIFGKKSGKKTGKKTGKKSGNKTGKIPQEAAKKKVKEIYLVGKFLTPKFFFKLKYLSN